MKKNKELIFWAILILAVQIFMLLLDSIQFPDGDLYHPFKYLYGDGYDRAKFYALEQYMWLVNLSLYCVMVVKKMTQCREENSYFSIVRYSSFRRYYLSVYKSFVIYTAVYQAAVFSGALMGYSIVRAYRSVAGLNWYFLLMSQMLMLLGNLFFGVIMLYAILQKDAIKCAVVVYPGIPVIALLSKEYLPQAVNNLIPGNWMMLARSRELFGGGFSIGMAVVLELEVFVLVSWRAVFKKKV
ncbi:MAG: hypothetical protein LUH14_04405 [Clostridiaceae bacterium]|nr:hypothetical protein [Clostridiaceae bacterium]